MQNNDIVKYEGGLIKRVGNAISVTNKLLSSNYNKSLQLYDPDKYIYSSSARNELTEFIKKNFWHFLNEIILKAKNKNYQTIEIPNEILLRIRANKNNYEFPRSSYLSRISGVEFDKKNSKNDYEISFHLTPSFKDEILLLICQTIVGNILSYFADTSIGNIAGIKLK